MSDKKKNYTSQEIADMLGVSRGTVYRALNNKGRIKEETKKKVLELAAELNYKPNPLARALVSNRTIRIAVIIPSYSEFFKQIESGMARSAEEIKENSGYKVELLCYRTGFANDGLKQIEVLESLVGGKTKPYDGILLIPAASHILKEGIDEIADAGTPLILVNGDVLGSRRLGFVGEPALSAGRTAGELMYKFSKKAGSVAVLEGYSNSFNTAERVKGFTQVMEEELPESEVLAPINYFEDAKKAYDITKRLIRDYRDLNGIFAAAATGLAPAAKAVYDMGKAGKINVIGFEYSADIKDLLQKGAVSAAISTSPKDQGALAVKTLVKYITGVELKSEIQHVNTAVLLKETDNGGLL